MRPFFGAPDTDKFERHGFRMGNGEAQDMARFDWHGLLMCNDRIRGNLKLF